MAQSSMEPGAITVGCSTPLNSLVIPKGILVKSVDGWIGVSAGASNNSVRVVGRGADWQLPGTLGLGCFGCNNRFEVLDGARVSAAKLAVGGRAEVPQTMSASNNCVVVAGPGSHLQLVDLSVGDSGSHNHGIITNGASLNLTNCVIGYAASAVGNQMRLSGLATRGRADAVYVGRAGSSNELIIANGARLECGELVVGGESSATGNQLTLSGGNVVADSFSMSERGVLEIGLDAAGGSGLVVKAMAEPAGTLRFTLPAEYAPAAGDRFGPITWSWLRIGRFDAVELPALGDDFLWQTNALYSSGVLTVLAAADLDRDALPDAWEMEYFGSTNAVPDGQDDGDIYSNFEEYVAGTDPTDTESYLGIFQPGIRTLTGTVVKWNAASNRVYSVKRYSGEIGGAVTTLVEHAEFPQNTYTDSVHEVWGFYQVEVRLK